MTVEHLVLLAVVIDAAGLQRDHLASRHRDRLVIDEQCILLNADLVLPQPHGDAGIVGDGTAAAQRRLADLDFEIRPLDQGEFTDRLEVVVQAVEGRQVRVTGGEGDVVFFQETFNVVDEIRNVVNVEKVDQGRVALACKCACAYSRPNRGARANDIIAIAGLAAKNIYRYIVASADAEAAIIKIVL